MGRVNTQEVSLAKSYPSQTQNGYTEMMIAHPGCNTKTRIGFSSSTSHKPLCRLIPYDNNNWSWSMLGALQVLYGPDKKYWGPDGMVLLFVDMSDNENDVDVNTAPKRSVIKQAGLPIQLVVSAISHSRQRVQWDAMSKSSLWTVATTDEGDCPLIGLCWEPSWSGTRRFWLPVFGWGPWFSEDVGLFPTFSGPDRLELDRCARCWGIPGELGAESLAIVEALPTGRPKTRQSRLHHSLSWLTVTSVSEGADSEIDGVDSTGRDEFCTRLLLTSGVIGTCT